MRQRTTTPPQSTTGRTFTLLELVIVLVVLALGLTLILPRIGRLPGRIQRERLFSRIERAFRYAGIRARATGTQAFLSITPDTGTIRLGSDPSSRENAPQRRAAAETESREASALPGPQTFNLPDDITWDKVGEDISYTFYPSGEIAGPDAISFQLRGERYTIFIDSLTGTPFIAAAEQDVGAYSLR